jgi:membrane protein required for colicin V production
MIEAQLSVFDASVFAVLALSCLFAFFRGFVREVLSLGAWIGAAIVTIYYFPMVAEKIRPHFKNPIGAAGVGTLGIYTTALICFSIINTIILKFIKSGSDVGMLDNLLGLFFGAFRGGVIIALAFFLYTIVEPDEKKYPDEIKKAHTYPYVEKSAAMLAKIAPEYLREVSSLQKKLQQEEASRPKISSSELDAALNDANKPASGTAGTTGTGSSVPVETPKP